MDITASVTSIKKGENDTAFFRIKNFENEQSYNCAYQGFLPIKEKDNIKGKIELVEKIWYFNELPLVIIAQHEELLYDTFFRALRTKKAHPSKVKEFITEMLKKYENINNVYQVLNEASCDSEKEIISEALREEQIIIYLRWWKKNMVMRQLYLWQLTNKEIKNSNTVTHNLAEKIRKNAFAIPSLSVEKAAQIEKLFGRKVQEKEVKQATIYRQIINCYHKGWSAIPLSYLLRMFPELPLYKNNLVDKYEVVFEEELVYSKESYEMENFLAEQISERVIKGRETELNNSVKLSKEIKGDIILTKQQNNALDNILKDHISVVTGGAGCGKTTLIKQLIHNLRIRGESFMLTSFTGKAVLRMKEIMPDYCQTKCFTMSRLIHKKNTRQPLDHFDHLIIDEASMISNELLYQFLSVFPHYYRIYLFGDCNQLPPVGSGNLLQQIINSGKINIHYLTVNKRIVNIENNHILQNANGLISKDRNIEEYFDFTNGEGFYSLEGDEKYCQQIIKGLAKQKVPAEEITVLTPFNKSIPDLIKCHQTNYLSSECYNYHNIKYFIGDRVMQTKNIYQEDMEIMNGEEGIIKKIDEKGILVKFSSKKEIIYQWANEREKIDEEDEESYESVIDTNQIKHSFCKTVHKSQGSEYNYVIIYIPNINNEMVNINLLYTAITRAKKTIWLVANKDNLREICKRKLKSKYEKLAIRIANGC